MSLNRSDIIFKINFQHSWSMLSILVLTLGILLVITFSSPTLAQEETETAPLVEEGSEEEAIPTGSVVNSKYLSITEHRYRLGDFSDQITGVVTNNSTAEVSGVSVDAALYDETNNLITMEGAGTADVSTLPPGDNSAFSITIFDLPEEVDHYTLFPSGTP
jgi:hypothetical protein